MEGIAPIATIAGAALMAGLTYVAAALIVMKPVTSDIRTLIAGRG
jgi:hypothetical protein